jgi:hypothetical protein
MYYVRPSLTPADELPDSADDLLKVTGHWLRTEDEVRPQEGAKAIGWPFEIAFDPFDAFATAGNAGARSARGPYCPSLGWRQLCCVMCYLCGIRLICFLS